MQTALFVTSKQLARAKANEQVTAAHLRQVRMRIAPCAFALLLWQLFLTWRVHQVHDVKAECDLVAFEARAESYYENCQDIAAKEVASVYQTCQDVLTTCESVKTDIWSYYSAQVAWLRGLGLD